MSRQITAGDEAELLRLVEGQRCARLATMRLREERNAMNTRVTASENEIERWVLELQRHVVKLTAPGGGRIVD